MGQIGLFFVTLSVVCHKVSLHFNQSQLLEAEVQYSVDLLANMEVAATPGALVTLAGLAIWIVHIAPTAGKLGLPLSQL